VHFSGHGSDSDEIVFQDDNGQAKPVTKEAIVQTMLACSGKIRLVFFNTCYSRGQAEAVIGHVEAAIGMTTSIGDKAARIFAAQFYSAIGFGLSLRKAFDQGKAALMLESIPEEDIPELFVEQGGDPDQFVIVKPGEADARVALQPRLLEIEEAREKDRVARQNKADLTARVRQDPQVRGLGYYKLSVTNSGPAEAREVSVLVNDMPYQEHADGVGNPKKPDTLGPGSSHEYWLKASVGPPFDIVIGWEDDLGAPGRFKTSFSS